MKITERGWGGHYICADRCLFRRNTLIEGAADSVVVSTVGAMRFDEKIMPVNGDKRYYETMAFGAVNEGVYVEANISDQRSFDSKWTICANSSKELPENIDNEANDMHEAVVAEFVKKLSEQS